MNFKQDQLERQQTALTVTKAKDMPHGQFEAVLSTEGIDRHGEIVSIKGLEIPKDRTFKMYWNHLTFGEYLPIGKWLKVWKKDGVLMGRGEIDLEDDFAVKVYKKVLGGFVDSISIGFYPREFDGENATWTKSELVEASVVGEPANTEAVVTSKKLDFTEEDFEQSLKVKLQQAKDVTEESTDDDGVSNAELKSIVMELKSSVGAVENALNGSTESPAIKQLIKVRMAGKEVDKAADELNKKLRIKLKETSHE